MVWCYFLEIVFNLTINRVMYQYFKKMKKETLIDVAKA
jgi:hypothetical protein